MPKSSMTLIARIPIERRREPYVEKVKRVQAAGRTRRGVRTESKVEQVSHCRARRLFELTRRRGRAESGP